MPFHSRNDLLVRTADGRNVVLAEPLEFVRGSDMARFRAPTGTTSDGASTPAVLWAKIPPSGPYWLAAVLHDAAYRDVLERLQGGQWVPAHLSKDECDQLFFEAMTCLGVEPLLKNVIYEGVHEFGQSSFDKDRA